MDYDCKICGKLLRGTVALNKHIGQKHKEISIKFYAEKYLTEEIIKCDKCDNKFFRSKTQQRKRKQQLCIECSKKERVKKLRVSGFYFKSGHILNETLNKSGKRNKIAKKSAITRSNNNVNPAIKSAKTRKNKNIDSFRESGLKAHLTRLNKGVYNLNRINGVYDKMIIKRHETMKKNNSYGKSKIEDSFYDLLKQQFNVRRQISTLKELKSKFIFMRNYHTFDFVVDDIFICFDGTYYHGLDRPITEIAKCKTKTDKIIFDTYYRDRNLESFCQNNNINLIRFNDLNFKNYISGKENLIPHFSCGNSHTIDKFLNTIKGVKNGISEF